MLNWTSRTWTWKVWINKSRRPVKTRLKRLTKSLTAFSVNYLVKCDCNDPNNGFEISLCVINIFLLTRELTSDATWTTNISISSIILNFGRSRSISNGFGLFWRFQSFQKNDFEDEALERFLAVEKDAANQVGLSRQGINLKLLINQ